MTKNEYTGKFIIIDGLDGSGKSLIVNGLADYLKKKGKKVFELKEFWKTSNSFQSQKSSLAMTS